MTSVLSVPAVASAAAWTPSIEVGTTDDTGSGITVDVGISGAALAGWSKVDLTSGGGPGAVQFAYKPAGGAFTAAFNPDPFAPEFPPSGQPPTPGRVSTANALSHVDLGNQGTAVWLRLADGEVYVSSTTNGTTYTAPLRTASALTSRMRSSQNLAGDLAIVNHDGLLIYKTAIVGSEWKSLGFAANVREASVAVDPNGRALIGWIDNSGRVKVRRFNLRTSAFITPARLVSTESAISPSDEDLKANFRVGIGVGADILGRGVVVWRRTVAGKEVVRAAFTAVNGANRAPGVRTVSNPAKRAGQFDVGMAPNGNATIAWTRRDFEVAGLARGRALFARRSPASPAWSPPTPILPGSAGIAFGAPSVAMARTFTYVAWYEQGPSITGTMHASRRVNVGPWAHTVLQENVDDRGVTPPEVAARGFYAVAGWRSGIGLCCAGYRVSVYDPAS